MILLPLQAWQMAKAGDIGWVWYRRLKLVLAWGCFCGLFGGFLLSPSFTVLTPADASLVQMVACISYLLTQTTPKLSGLQQKLFSQFVAGCLGWAQLGNSILRDVSWAHSPMFAVSWQVSWGASFDGLMCMTDTLILTLGWAYVTHLSSSSRLLDDTGVPRRIK